MKRFVILATLTLMAASCNRRQTVPAIDLANLDTSVAPETDFYQYATGGWQARNPLKPEFARYGSFDALRENNEVRINDLFEQLSHSKAAAGSVERKIADLYNMGLDSVRLNAEGITPVRADIEKIMAVTDPATLAAAIADMHSSASNALFGVGVEADLMDSNANALYISQSGIMMGDRDYYLDEESASLRKSYVDYLTRLFALYGMEDAAQSAAEVLAFETSLAKAFRSSVELRDYSRMYNPMSREEFEKRYDAVDWTTYFNGIGLPEFETIIVGQPEVLDAVNSLIETESMATLRKYLVAHELTSAAPYMNDEIYAVYFDFFGRTMSGTQEMKPRWKRAMSIPNSLLGEAVGEMYVEKYFPAKDKERMVELVKNLQVALGEHIDALTWMSDETKARAREKLAAFTVKIGYPDKWKDYTSLEIDPALSYWDNLKRANRWYSADNLSRLGKPVDRDEWFMSPQTVNAYYNPTTNEICFPAAILQPPFYNPDADDAVNYGAIGVVIGHEMTHGFDDQGRNFDKDGNMNNWWTEADAEAFKAKTDILVKQFDAIEVLPGMHANGALSLGENIADQGGLRVAYTAYRNSLGGTEPAPIDGFTAAQRFYLAYAGLWAQNIRDEEIARLTKLDVHSLGKWRVNATLRNISEFYDAFGIEQGAMFMPESERVIIW